MDFLLLLRRSTIATPYNYYANENQRYVVKTLAKMFHNIKNSEKLHRNLYSYRCCFFVSLMTYLHWMLAGDIYDFGCRFVGHDGRMLAVDLFSTVFNDSLLASCALWLCG